MSSRHFLSVIAFSLLAYSLAAQAAPEPVAVLPADVVDKLLRAPHSQPVDGFAAELAQRLDEAEDIVSRWEKETATGQRDGATVDRAAQIQGQAAMIDALKAPALSRLGQEETRVVKAAPSKKSGQVLAQAHSLRADRVSQAFAKLDAALQTALAAAPGERAQALARAKAVLRQLRGDQRDRELSPSAVPWPTHRLGEMAGPSPRQKTDTLPRYLSEQQSRYFNSVASNGKIILAAAPVTPGEAGQCYAGGAVDSEDMSATPDAQKNDPEVQALAEKLVYSPAKILAWVHDNIKYEPYWGSLKGAKGALVSGAGNATDQASLMIALLRASNIPARYVTGNIIVRDPVPTQPGGRVLRWLGAKTYTAAASILANGGVSGATIYPDGVGFEHVWVQACVPYTHYRGAALSNAGHRWIPLDAAFKDKAYRQDIDVNVSFNYTFNSGDYLAARTDELPHERYARQVESALLPLNKDTTDLSPEGRVKAMKLDILPASLPYAVTSFVSLTGAASAEPSALPAAHRYALDVTVKNSAGTVLLSRTMTYPDASLKRLTLSFAPSDSASQTWWNGWNGSFATLPTSGVNVKPVIKLDGVDVAGATAGATALTSSNRLTLIIKMRLADNNFGATCVADSGSGVDPDTTCANKTVYDNIKPGAYHALQAYAFQGSDRYLKERAAQLIAAVRTNAAPTPATPAAYEATLGEFLHLSLVKYLRYGVDSTKQIGESMNIAGWRGNDIGLTTVDLKTEYLMDQPFAIKTGGLLIDVKGGLTRMTKLDTTATDGTTQRNEIWPAFKLALYTGSAFEHYIWQEMARTDAVSTVRGLQFAKETGDSIVTLNSSNIGSWSSLMDVSMNPYQPQIAGYVSQGATITVPRKKLAYVAEGSIQTWNGAVYMAENQGAGSFGALISGGFGGGWGAPLYTSLSTNYFYDAYTPTTLTIPNTSLFSFTNSTTSSLGFNTYQTMSGDPVNMVTGNFYHVERDLSIPGRGGLPLVFERSYNSRKPANGTLGWGWTHSFNHSLRFYGVESAQAKVSWIDGTGGEKFFATTSHTSGIIAVNTPLLNSPGIFVTFKREASGQYTIREKNGLTYTFESVNSGATNTGLNAKLLSIKDRNNNTLAATYTGSLLNDITDGAGRKLAFTYTGGLLTRLEFKKTGGAVVRTHEYTYDGAGNLAAHKSPATLIDPVNSPAVTYQYYTATDGANLDHAMKQYLLPRGNGMKFDYYADGRVFRHNSFAPGGASLGQETSFAYNSFRRETVQVNERGLTRRFLFDERGNLTNLTEENGAYRSYVYDTANPFNRTQKTDPYGMVSQYAYDTLGNVTQITNPDGATVQYLDFNAFNQPRRIKDARGNYRLLKYDAAGNLTDDLSLKAGVVPVADVTPAAGNMLAWNKHAYDSFGNRTGSRALKSTSGAILGNFNTGIGPVVSTAFDASGLYPVGVSRLGDKTGDGIDDSPDSETLAYDDQGRETRGIDASWHIVQRQYDPVDRIKRATDAQGLWRDYQYDANGNPVNESLIVANSLADSNSAQYDGADRKVQSLDAGGHATRWELDARGNPIRIADADGYSLDFEYDAMDRWVVAYDKEGNSVTRSLDISGRARAVTDPNGLTTTTTWYGASKNGRLQQSIDALGRATTYDYDPNGNRISITDNAGQTSKIFYDALNRPVRSVGPLVNSVYPVTCAKFNLLGYPAEIWAGSTLDATSPSCDMSGADTSIKKQTAVVFNDMGWKVQETDPLGKVSSASHDKHGNVLAATDAKNQTTVLTWTYGHQLQTRTVKNADGSVYTSDSLTRNPLGQPLTVSRSNPAQVQTMTYDAAHRLIRSTDDRNTGATKALDYDWSPGGMLNLMQDSEGNRTDYLYDAVGRLIGIWAPNFDYLAFSHDAGGRLTEKWHPNGHTARYSYNPDGSLATLTNRTAAATILTSHAYEYDTLGRRYRHSDTTGTLGTQYNQYTYDPLSRLVQSQTCASNYTGCTAQETNTYDIWDNRKTSATASGTLAYVYDAAHQLKETRNGSDTGPLIASYAYDANGNLTSRPGQGLAWNPDNQLTGIADESYAYDPEGRRIQKTSTGTGTSTHYRYNGMDIHAEYSNFNQNPQAVYVHGAGIDDPAMRLTGSTSDPTATASFYHQDGLNSVIGQSTQTGTTQGLQRFDAWGNKTQSSGTINQYGYTGREPDATGLIYYRARYYDPSIGRFISRDPAGMPDGVNLYAYVGNSPTNLIDPTGLWSASVEAYLGIGGGIVFSYDKGTFEMVGRIGVGLGGGLAIEPQGSVSRHAQSEGSNYIARTFTSGSAEIGLGPLGYGGSVTLYSGNAVTHKNGGGYVEKSQSTLSASPEVKKPYFGLKGGVAYGVEIGSYSNCVVTSCSGGATSQPSPTPSDRVIWRQLMDEPTVPVASSGNQTLQSFYQMNTPQDSASQLWGVNSGTSYTGSVKAFRQK